MTRVLVDLLFHTGQRGGMESYVRHLYAAMPAGTEFVALASAELAATGAPWFPGEVIDSGVRSRSRIAWTRGELLDVPAAARRVGADVVHCPANVGPWWGPTPVVLTLHDLLPFRHPEWVPGPYGPLLRRLVRTSARRARRIVTPAHVTIADIEDALGIPADRIDVIPLGADARPWATTPREPDLLFALGNRLPHKNFPRLLKAFAAIPLNRRPRLVLTGGAGPDALAAQVAELGLSSNVVLEGWVNAERLEELYASAAALIVPTLFEGFGLPVLEAMSRGCPVICSDLPVLREVAADAAVYIDPLDTDGMAATIIRTLADPGLLRDLTVRGLERSGAYSWGRAARATLRVLERAATAN